MTITKLQANNKHSSHVPTNLNLPSIVRVQSNNLTALEEGPEVLSHISLKDFLHLLVGPVIVI